MNIVNAYTKVLGLFISLVFVSPQICLCHTLRDNSSSLQSDLKNASSHCHEKEISQPDSSQGQGDCCNSEEHGCVSKLDAQNVTVSKKIDLQKVNHIDPFVQLAETLLPPIEYSYFALLKKQLSSFHSKPTYIRHLTLLI